MCLALIHTLLYTEFPVVRGPWSPSIRPVRKIFLYLKFCFVLFLTLNLVKLKKSFDILSHLIFEVDRPHVLPLMLQSGKSRAGEFKRLAQGNFANICRDLIPRLVSYSPGLLLLQLSGHSILEMQGPLMGLLEIWILALLEATCVTLNKTL